MKRDAHVRTGLMLLGVLAMYCGNLIAAETAKAKDDPVDLIRKANLFGIGPVGYAGTISAPERALDQIVKQENSRQVLMQLFGEATLEGQMYALVGLKQVDKSEFESRVKGFKGNSAELRTITGCIVSSHPASEITRAIAAGRYDPLPELSIRVTPK
jgi:hypothetical protein